MTAPDRLEQRLRVTTALALVLFLLVVWNPVGNLQLPGAFYVPANIAVAGLAVVIARLAGSTWVELGLDRETLPRGLRVGAVSALVVGVAVAAVVLVPAFRSFFESDAVAADSGLEHWFIPAVRIPIGTAVFEELLFRSVLFALLVRLRDVRVAVIMSSIVFGLWHIVPAWESAADGAGAIAGAVVGTVAITMVAGVIFALLRVRSGSVVASMMAHAAVNSFSYLGALVVVEHLG